MDDENEKRARAEAGAAAEQQPQPQAPVEQPGGDQQQAPVGQHPGVEQVVAAGQPQVDPQVAVCVGQSASDLLADVQQQAPQIVDRVLRAVAPLPLAQPQQQQPEISIRTHPLKPMALRPLSSTVFIKRVEIEENFVNNCDMQMPNQIDRTYHITISTDAADDTPAHQETVRFLTTDVMRSFNNTMADDNYNTSQSNLNAAGATPATEATAAAARRQRSTDREDELAAMEAEHQQQMQQQHHVAPRPTRIADEMSQDLQYLSREAPLDGGESTFGAYSTLGGSQLHVQQQQLRTPTPGGDSSLLENDYERTDFRINDDDEVARQPIGAEQLERQAQQSQQQLEQLAPDNVDIQRPLQQAG